MFWITENLRQHTASCLYDPNYLSKRHFMLYLRFIFSNQSEKIRSHRMSSVLSLGSCFTSCHASMSLIHQPKALQMSRLWVFFTFHSNINRFLTLIFHILLHPVSSFNALFMHSLYLTLKASFSVFTNKKQN